MLYGTASNPPIIKDIMILTTVTRIDALRLNFALYQAIGTAIKNEVIKLTIGKYKETANKIENSAITIAPRVSCLVCSFGIQKPS